LGQVPTVRDLAGIGLVILGVALHRDRDIPASAGAPSRSSEAPDREHAAAGTSEDHSQPLCHP
jgi:hypothetical protein